MNSFGNIFKITTWGESHGKAIGVVIDGCPSGLAISEEELTDYLYRGDCPIPVLATEREEPNKAEFLSGVYDSKTIGTPISIIIRNEDVKSKDYKILNGIYRPGHGEYGYFLKYNSSYQSGGGRASGRECIARIAAGYIAEKIIRQKFSDYEVISDIADLAGIDTNDQTTFEKALNKALNISDKGDSTGGLIKIGVKGVPHGLGEPIFDGMDAKLASALMSIGSVKSFEIGAGRISSMMSGSEFNDDFAIIDDDTVTFISNNHGGTLGGISTGESIEILLAIKPTPSIRLEKVGVTRDKRLEKISVNGRHDKNITPRIIPIARAMISLVILDFLMMTGKIGKDRIE